MKFFKSSILALAALLASAGFTACSDDDNYTPGAQSTGIYFPESASATVSLDKLNNATSFSVPVDRSGATEAASYPIVVTVSDDSEGVFTLPTSVSFAQGATSSEIVIGCDLEKAAYQQKFTFTIKLGEGVAPFNYGSSSCTFTATIPAAYTDFVPFAGGTCCWYYDLGFAFSGDDPGLPIVVHTSLAEPDLQEIQIQHWGVDVPLNMYYDTKTGLIRIPPQFTGGVNADGDGNDLYICDMHTYCDEFLDGQYYTVWSDLIQYPSYFDDETGMIYANVVYYLSPVEDPTEDDIILYNGAFGFETCQVSGFPDYACSFKYRGLFIDADTEDSYALFDTKLGMDCTEGKIMVSNTASADELLAAIKNGESGATAVANGDSSVSVRLSGGGEYTAVFAGLQGDEIVASAITTFTVGTGAVSDHQWTPYGTGMIIDGWFTAAWNFKDQSGNIIPNDEIYWPFEVEYDAANRGMYRMVNVWGSEDAPVVYLGLNSCTTPRNIIIDATNEQCVVWTPQLTGFMCTSFPSPLTGKELYAANLQGYYMATEEDITAEDLIDAGYECPLEDDIFLCEVCLFGTSVDECSLNWNSEPYGMVALSLPEDNGVIGKYKSIQNLKDKYAVAGMMRKLTKSSKTAKPMIKVRNLVVGGEVKNVEMKSRR